jgi:hypothetical protein
MQLHLRKYTGCHEVLPFIPNMQYQEANYGLKILMPVILAVIIVPRMQRVSEQLVRCIPHVDICRDFEIANGHFTVEGNTTSDFTNGSRVTLFCDQDYGPTYGSNVVTCSGGTWLPARPDCNHKYQYTVDPR